MAQFVFDKAKKRVVIFPKKGRLDRPEDLGPVVCQKKGRYNYLLSCPFCLGNEAMTPREIYQISNIKDQKSEDKYSSDIREVKSDIWTVRVVPNKFPITDIHEVVILSADHCLSFEDFDQNQLSLVFGVFQKRFEKLASQGQVFIFGNSGAAAGPSLNHPHAQITVIDSNIHLDVLGLQDLKNVFLETSDLAAYCPEFSQWPYEIWLSAKKNFDRSGEVLQNVKKYYFNDISVSEIAQLGGMFPEIIRRLKKKFRDLSYNYYIAATSPWYLRLIPRTVVRAGFELATEVTVNVQDPKEAAEELRIILRQ